MKSGVTFFQSLNTKVIVLIIIISLPILSLIFIDAILAQRESHQIIKVLKDNEAIHNLTQEISWTSQLNILYVEKILLIENAEKLDAIEQLQAEFEEVSLQFGLLMDALIWGSGSKEFKEHNDGKTYHLWKERGLDAKFNVPPPPRKVYYLAGALDVYSSAYFKYARKVIQVHKEMLSPSSAKKGEAIGRSYQQAKHYKWWIKKTLTELLTETDRQMEFSHEEIRKTGKESAFVTIAGGHILIIVMIISIWIFYQRFLIRPLREIMKKAEKIAGGQWDIKIPIKTSDEIGHLAQHFNEMTENLKRTVVSRDTLLQEIETRKKAEESLETQRAALDQSVILVESDIYGKIIYANDHFCRISKYSRKEVIGKDHRELVNSGYHSKAFWKEFWDTIMQGKIWRGEICNRDKEGVLYWTDTTIIPKFDKQGNLSKYLAVRTIITEQKNAQKVIEGLHRRNQLILNSVGEGIYGLDLNRNTTFINPSALKMLGYDKEEEIIGQQMHTLIHHTKPDGTSYDSEACLIHSSIKDGSIQRVDNEVFWRKDGSSFPCEYISTPIRENKKVVGVVVSFIDITDRKRSEESIREKNELLQILQAVAVTANEATNVNEAMQFILDKICTYIKWPVGHIYILEEHSGELEPTKLWHLAEPDRYQTFREVTEKTTFKSGAGLPGRVLLSGQPAWINNVMKDSNFPRAKLSKKLGVKAGFAFPILIKNKVMAVLEFFSNQEMKANKPLLEVMAQMVTQLGRVIERKQAEEALHQSEAQLRQSQKMEAVGKLAGGVAHDFNNLLMVIHGYSEFLLKEIDSEDSKHVEVEEIKKAADRAIKLTQQLLAFSRRQIVQLQVVDLSRSLHEMEKMLKRLIGENIEISISSKKDLEKVKVDLGQVEQVILNLAVNARDAMPDGGRIVLKADSVLCDREFCKKHPEMSPGHYVVLTVRDSGEGMADDVKDQIFEPFFTTKKKGKGTGLGLATVYGIVRQNKGFIYVDSKVDRGTTFSIYFPSVEEEVNVKERDAAEEELPRGTETILLVEDEDSLREIIAKILDEQGYKVYQANNGVAALEELSKLKEEKVDLLLTDIMMPQMGGKELHDCMEQIRPGIKTIFMSGYTDDLEVRRNISESGAPFLQKPFTPQILSSKLREVLEGRN